MNSKKTSLKKEVEKKLAENKKKILFVFDFDGTLIDTFNSVLKPLFKEIHIDLGSYEEFSQRNGTIKKYLFCKKKIISNIREFYHIKQFHIQELLKEYYLQYSKEIPTMKALTSSISKLNSVEFGVVSRNYVSDYFNPNDMIKEVVKEKEFFSEKDFFVKRVSPLFKKTTYFKHIREQYKDYLIISIGDQIDDYTSAIKANFNIALSIEGYDSNTLFKKKNISPINIEELENTIYNKILEYFHTSLTFKDSQLH